MLSTLSLLALLPLALAHFELVSPAGREGDEEQMGTFPCGGGTTVSEERTPFPLAGGPIQLSMGHDESAVQVLIGLGNDPGEAFNTVLMKTIQERGPGDFCLGNIMIPADLGVREGDNATVQVVTNGDPTGGLYNCADITFTSQPNPDLRCTNGSDVTTMEYTGRAANANGTGEAATSASGTASGSASAATPSSTGAAGKLQIGGFLAFAGAVVGAVGMM